MGGGKLKEKRGFSFFVIAVCYMAAIVVGAVVYFYLGGPIWARILGADIAATLFIWVLSMLLKNASLYDPYWSVQPVIILTLLLIKNGRYDIGSILMYSVITLWGIRLTANWAYTFHGLHIQDWRYDKIQAKTGRLYQLINLTGIQIMPTIIVFLCILPAIYLIELNSTFNKITALGLFLCLGATGLQLIADYQMQIFRRENTDRSKLISSGLWKYSRHPNYLGEILMWWGVYLTMLSVHKELWYLCIGAIGNTMLFLFISIPLAEKRLTE